MSRSLGNSLPPELHGTLSHNNSSRQNLAIFLVVSDDDDYPHVALLSPYQVVASNPAEVYIGIHAGTRTEGFLQKRNKALLIIQAGPAVVYAKCVTSRIKDWEDTKDALYSASFFDVLEDYSESAPFVSQLSFLEKNVMAYYSAEFGKLSKYVSSHA